MKNIIKSIINGTLSLVGLEMRKKTHTPTPTHSYGEYYTRLSEMYKLGFNPKVIYDCGAFTGEWSSNVSTIFKDAHFFLFEPNPTLHDRINKNLQKRANPYELCKKAVGETQSTLNLNLWGVYQEDGNMAGASLLGHVIGEPTKKIEVEVISLNSFAQNHPKPDFVKMDLQGAEIMALRGASDLFKTVEVFILEFGLIYAYENRTTVKQIFDIMYENDFVLYDIIDLAYRPLDGALGGGDFTFVRKDSQLRKSNHWG
jgi:FkbM family methyltransferase